MSPSVGQLLMIEFEENRWKPSTRRRLGVWRPSGLVFSARALDTPQGTAELLRNGSPALGSPPLLALEGGGSADPLRALFPPLPSPRMAAQKGLAAVGRLARLRGAALRLLGFNTDFGPVLDLGISSSEHIDVRTFGSRPEEVARYGGAFVRGLEQSNILACAQRFPGLRGVDAGDDSALRVVRKTMAELWREDLVPYRRLRGRLPMVLMSRASYKAYDFDVPCSAALSASVVEGLLRMRLGYRQLAIADGLEREAVRGPLDLGEAAAKSINAGCDLLLVRGERNVEAVLAGLSISVESGRLPTTRIEQALERIHAVKKSIAFPSGRVSRSAFDQLAREFEGFAKELRAQERKIA